MKHVLRTILFALFGAFDGLDRVDDFNYTLARIRLPMGLTGRFPIPLVLRRTDESYGRPITVDQPRSWAEEVQSRILRPAFGLEIIQAYREALAEKRKAKRKNIRIKAKEKIEDLGLRPAEEVKLLGELSSELSCLTRQTPAVKELGGPIVATEQSVVMWANRHLGRDQSLPIPLA